MAPIATTIYCCKLNLSLAKRTFIWYIPEFLFVDHLSLLTNCLFECPFDFYSVAEFNNVMNGLKTAGEMIEHARTFMKNTKTVDVMKTTKIPYHVSLAASYGNLNSESIKALDEELKVSVDSNRALNLSNLKRIS